MKAKYESWDIYDRIDDYLEGNLSELELYNFEYQMERDTTLFAEVQLLQNLFIAFTEENEQVAALRQTLQQLRELEADYAYIDGLLENDSSVIKKMYKLFFPRIEAFVLKNRGRKADAWDVFQDALIVILKRVKKQDFELVCDFYIFLFGVCRFVWMNKLRLYDNNHSELTITTEIFEDPVVWQMLVEEEQKKLYEEKLRELTDRGQMVMRLFFKEGKKHREIAKIMGFKNENVAKKQKAVYQKQLTQKIQRDWRYREVWFGE